MIADALSAKEHTKKAPQLSALEYEKTLAMLNESKAQLGQILESLEKFSPNNFWGNSNIRRS